MEAACISQIPTTNIINCIWHLVSLNIPKNLCSIIGLNWEAFTQQFWIARNALTTDEFEQRWSVLTQEFGGIN